MPQIDYVLIDTWAGTGVNGGIATVPVDTGASGITGTIGSVSPRTPAVTFYASVQDLDAYLDRAHALGAAPTTPAEDRRPRPTEVAHVVDPEGQIFALTRQP